MDTDIREKIHQAVNSFTTIELESIPHFIQEDFEKIRQLVFMEMSHAKSEKPYKASWSLLEDAKQLELSEVMKEIPGALKRLQDKTFRACDSLPPTNPA